MTESNSPFRQFLENRLPGPPSSKFLGWKCLDYNVEDATILIEFDPPEECLNPARGIAGGFISEMLDQTVSPLVTLTLDDGQFPSAVEFKVSFIRPVKQGTVTGRAKILHRGSALVFAEGELLDSDNRVLAKSTQTLRIVKIKDLELDFGQTAP